MTRRSKSRWKVPGWRFWVPLTAQVLLILIIPAQAALIHLTGKTVVLQMGPVDPYDLFRGYYVVLSYDISNPEFLEDLSGWEDIEAASRPVSSATSPTDPSLFETGTEFFITLQAPEESNTQPPQTWEPVAVSLDRPSDVQEDQVVLKGVFRRGRVTYGLETYFIPEDKRQEINQEISQLQGQPDENPPFVVEVKVDAEGRAVPLGFWLRDRRYRF